MNELAILGSVLLLLWVAGGVRRWFREREEERWVETLRRLQAERDREAARESFTPSPTSGPRRAA